MKIYEKIAQNIFILVIVLGIFAIGYAEDEFDAKLVISNDLHFDSKWNNTLGIYAPFIHTFKEVYRGEVIHLRIFFSNMALNENGLCDVSYDVKISNPNNEVYFSEKNILATKSKIHNPSGIFLAETLIGNEFEAKDMLGKYHLLVTVHDNIAKKEIILEDDIVLLEYGSDKKELSNEELWNLVMFYYKKPDSHRIFDILELVYKYEDEDKEEFTLRMAPMLRAFFKDNKYLFYHLVKHINHLDGEKRKEILPIIKGVSLDYPDLPTALSLDESERKALSAINYPDIWDDTIESAVELDMLWMSFFATGEIESIKQLIKAIKLKQDKDINRSVIGGAAIWSLTSNCRQHALVKAYCISIYEHDESLDDFTRNILGKCIADSEEPNNSDVQEEAKFDKEALEVRVNEILKKDNVSQRLDIDEVFLLADIYVEEGKVKEAIELYQKALRVDSWRLEYQLKLAHLLREADDINQATEKAKIVYQLAEDEALIIEAEKLLSELGVKFAEERKAQKFVDDVELIIVPIGKVNKRLLDEARKELQEKIGIKYSIMEGGLEPGEIDRSYTDGYLADVVDRIKSDISQEEVEELMSEKDLTAPDLKTVAGKMKFINAYFSKIHLQQLQIVEFYNTVEDLEGKGQFDADRLISEMQKEYPVEKVSKIKGYLGITEKDIFSGDNNFLFGLACPGYGVMSYHRFKAEFNKEPPNRLRLRKRLVKQGISSSFFIFGIPRCTTPTCARAYPHSLTEHDEKGIEICSWCKERLKAYIEENRLGLIKSVQQKLQGRTIPLLISGIFLIIVLPLFVIFLIIKKRR